MDNIYTGIDSKPTAVHVKFLSAGSLTRHYMIAKSSKFSYDYVIDCSRSVRKQEKRQEHMTDKAN